MSKSKMWGDTATIKRLAKMYNWELFSHDEMQYLLRFRRNGMTMNIYYSQMTVATILDHPWQGKTQLFRKSVGYKMLESIFRNPRVHTKKGYRRL